jgi:SAM-dependent methyltransferase
MSAINHTIRRVGRRLVRTRFELETIRSLYLDLRYGGYCGGAEPSRFAHLGSNAVMSTEYQHLDAIFGRAGVQVLDSDVLVDIGCGKGRVINYWLRKGYRNRIVGLELDDRVAARLKKRLARRRNVEVVQGDAVENLPADGTVFFAYNPFNKLDMERLKARMEALYAPARGAVLLYHNCHFADLFVGDPAWQTESLGHVGTLPLARVVLPGAHPRGQRP